MGAELTLRSAVGEGSTFYFDVDMPFASTLVTLAGNDLEAEHQWQSALTELSGMPVLVIDDNVVALELAATMVTTCGWQVDSAAGGQEALALLRHRCAQNLPPYRAIFLDWEMSGLDGWETLHAIHELNENIGSPLMIMLTGHGRDQLNSRSAQEQAQLHAFLVKPVTATMIQEAVVNAHLGHSNLRTKARSNSLSSARLSGIRILVVEDNRINQQVVQELLVAQGAIVELAENGQLGVDAIVSTRPPFDVVLMDLQMPVMDGYAATKVLREQLGMHDLPIIAMTANAMASDRVQCLAAGMNAHVGKPFDLPHLISVVLQYAKPRAVVVHASEVPEPPLLPPEQMSPLPILDGFDIAGALDKMGGNTDLYGDILLSYIAEVQTNPDQLDALLSHDDFAGAARLLHTLKGLSGTVGAMALAERAKHWETILKNAPTQQDAASVSVRFQVEIATAIRALQEVAKAIGISTDSTPAANELPLLARLEQLRDMLQQEDLAAIDFFAELQVSLLSEWAETSALVALSAAMENFDLVSAEAACIQLITECTPQEA
jgi:CheY-like chemotaxis protein